LLPPCARDKTVAGLADHSAKVPQLQWPWDAPRRLCRRLPSFDHLVGAGEERDGRIDAATWQSPNQPGGNMDRCNNQRARYCTSGAAAKGKVVAFRKR
jgi:hypothetical protein